MNNVTSLPLSKHRKQRKRQKFDSRGGVIVMSRNMLNHENYLSLTAQAKVLMNLMQQHWHDEKEIDYGVREASKKIPCSKKTAMKAFKQLEEHGFIENASPAIFSSRTQSRTRTWRLTWMPFCGRDPTHKWEKWTNEN
ncbi:MAG: hypothetical protein ACPHLK_06530 [Gammaproteobacteria bacterium]|jgi:hypothetical protein